MFRLQFRAFEMNKPMCFDLSQSEQKNYGKYLLLNSTDAVVEKVERESDTYLSYILRERFESRFTTDRTADRQAACKAMSRETTSRERRKARADGRYKTEIRRLINVVETVKSVDMEKLLEQYRTLMTKAGYSEILKKEEVDQYGVETDIDQIHSSVEGMELDTEPLSSDDRKDMRCLKQTVKTLTNDLETKNRQLASKDKQLKELNDNNQLIYANQYEDNKGLKADNEFMKKKMEEMEREVKSMKMKYETALSDKEKAEREKTDALTRLSKSMGSKLSDNNPSIADLSDQNRATKLAEKFSELYDNEWTEAMEILEKSNDEERAITILLTVAKESFKYCKTTSEEQMQNLEQHLITPGSKRGSGDMTKENKKLLKDCRKASSIEAIDSIQKGFMASLKINRLGTYTTHIDQYVLKCVELFWLMCVQDPPVTLGPDPEVGDKFDLMYYRYYTATGSTVKYVVWPPLLLYDGGPILSKGVAQPIKTEPKERHASSSNYSSEKEKTTMSNRAPVSQHINPRGDYSTTSYAKNCDNNTDMRSYYGSRSVHQMNQNHAYSTPSDAFGSYAQLYGDYPGQNMTQLGPTRPQYNTTYTSAITPTVTKPYIQDYVSPGQGHTRQARQAWGADSQVHEIYGATHGHSNT
ncbi:hypothetical protein ScPMuIL_011168 [Solemya velum]